MERYFPSPTGCHEYMNVGIVLRFLASGLSATVVALHLVLFLTTTTTAGGVEASDQHIGVLVSYLVWVVCAIWALVLFYRQNKKTTPPERGRPEPGLLQFVCVIYADWTGLVSPIYVAIAFLLALVTTAILSKPVALAIVSVPAGIAATIVMLLRGDRMAPVFGIMAFTTCAATILLKQSYSEWRKQNRMLEQARWAASEFVRINARMQDLTSRTEEWEQNRERTRLAREIHDSVGYALTAILVQIGVLKEVHDSAPEKLDPIFREFEELIRETIDEVRGRVAELRDDELRSRAWRSRWIRLCQVFSDFTAIRIQTNITEDLEFTDEQVGATIYRILQEALTNAYRHGGATYVDVALAWMPENEKIVLRVSDNGVGARLVRPGSGLKGMAERVESLKGRLVWQTLPGQGFDIGVTIPFREDRR